MLELTTPDAHRFGTIFGSEAVTAILILPQLECLA